MISSFYPVPLGTTNLSPNNISAASQTSLFLNCHSHQLYFSSSQKPRHHSHRLFYLRYEIGASQPYDCEAELVNLLTQSTKPRLTIVGFGEFGQFLAKTFVRQGHTINAHSRSNYHSVAQSIGVVFFSDPHDLCERHPDIILICTSILSTKTVLKSEGCVMVEMTCAEHYVYAAKSQFITHTVGRILEKLQLESTPINTKGCEALLNLVKSTTSDSFELYNDIFMHNKNSMKQLERLDSGI